MVENYENKNFNGKETPEQTHTNQFSTNKEAQVKGETVYDDKVIQKIIGSAIDKIDGLLMVVSSRMLRRNWLTQRMLRQELKQKLAKNK